MTNPRFTDKHLSRSAFVANLLNRLADQISSQGEDMLRAAGLDFPSRAVSAVLLIGEQGAISAADIALELAQPHQLATQRIDLLEQRGLIERMVDPQDRRRKCLALTAKGAAQYRVLTSVLESADQAFDQLFAELDCDLREVARRSMHALDERPLARRVDDSDESPTST